MKHKDRMNNIASIALPPPETHERFLLESYLNATRTPEIKKELKKRFNIAKSNVVIQLLNGAGYVQDETIREFHLEYNSRNASQGLWSLPSSFNVLESFFNYIPDLNYFQIKDEFDFKISFNDYIDFITSSKIDNDVSAVLHLYQDNVIYNYNNIDGENSLVYKIGDNVEFIPYGYSINKNNSELNILSVFGIKDDKQRDKNIEPEITSPAKKFIKYDPEKYKIVTMDDECNFQKVVILNRLDLENKSQNARYIMRDYGNGFDVLTDDINALQTPYEKLTNKDYDLLKTLSGQIDENYSELFSFTHTLINICHYLENYDEIITIERTKTKLKNKRKKGYVKKALKDVDQKNNINYRNIKVLNKQFDYYYDNLEIISPTFRIETKGFWKRIPPTSIGLDKVGNKVFGRTWVTQTLTWYGSNRIEDRIKSKSKSNMYNTHNSGIIYLMRNASHAANIFKIGLTQRNSKTRASELSRTTGQPDNFLVAYEWDVKNCKLAEKIIHEKLKNCRINDKREFFKAEYSLLMNTINNIVNEINRIE